MIHALLSRSKLLHLFEEQRACKWFDGAPLIEVAAGIKVRLSGTPYEMSTDHLLQYGGVAEELQPFIAGYSFHDKVEKFSYRLVGEYRLRTATLVLSDLGDVYFVKVKGKELKDLQDLYRLVREGLAYPIGNYQAPMVPPPARHLRQLLRELCAVIMRDIRLRLRLA